MTDAGSRLASKGKEAKFSYIGHTAMENRNRLIVNARTSIATVTAERDTAIKRLVSWQAISAESVVRIKTMIHRILSINVVASILRLTLRVMTNVVLALRLMVAAVARQVTRLVKRFANEWKNPVVAGAKRLA